MRVGFGLGVQVVMLGFCGRLVLRVRIGECERPVWSCMIGDAVKCAIGVEIAGGLSLVRQA